MRLLDHSRGPRSLPLLAALCGVAVLAGSVRAQLVDQKLLICDTTAQHAEEYPGVGSLLLQAITGDSSTVFYNAPPLKLPFAATVDVGGAIVMTDRGAVAPGDPGGNGAVIRFHPFSTDVDFVVGSPLFDEICDVAVNADGRILVADKRANPLGLPQGDTGAIYAIDPATHEVSVFSSLSDFVDPVGVLVDSTGAVYVIDENSNPFGFEDGSGAIWEIDRNTGAFVRLVTTSPEFSTPGDAVRVGNFLYLLDTTALVTNGTVSRNSGDVFRIDLVSGEPIRYFPFTPFFVRISDIEYLAGKFWLIDRDITFPEGGSGGLYSVDPRGTRRPSRFTGSPLWSDPRSIVFLPTSRIDVVRHEFVDLNGPPLSPFDELAFEVELGNSVTVGSGFALTDSLEAFLTVDPLSIVVDSGEASLTTVPRPAITWTGSIGVGESAMMTFRATLGEVERLRQPLEVVAELRDDGAGQLVSTIRDTVYRELADDEVIIADAVSFVTNGRLLVVRGDGESYESIVEPPEELLDPTRLLSPTDVVVDTAGVVFVVDPQIQVPPDSVGYGAVLRYRPTTGELDLFSVRPSYRDPVALAIDPGGRLLVLDNGIVVPGGGRGVLFSLDLETGAVMDSVSDSRWVQPEKVAFNSRGEILVLDRRSEIGGYEGAQGAVFRITAEGDVFVDTVSPEFRQLRAIVPVGVADYLLVDSQRDAVFISTAEGVSVFAQSAQFQSPWAATITRFGDLLVADNANSTIFRVSLATGDVEPFIQIPILELPIALATRPAPRFEGSSFIAFDLNGGNVLPGDVIRWNLQIRNTGTLNADAVLAVNELPAHAEMEVGSLGASAGSASYDALTREVHWEGSLEIGAVANIFYRTALSTAIGMGTRVTNTAIVTPESGEPLVFTRTLVARGPFLAGDLLAVDPDTGGGTLYRRDVVTDLADLMVEGEPFVTPVAVTVDAAQRAVILDQNADPSGAGDARGAVFRYDPVTDTASTIASSPFFVDPTDIVATADGYLVLDEDADPFSIGQSPGAVFEILDATGAVVDALSDPVMHQPQGFALDTDGTLIIADPGAVAVDGVQGQGALLRADLDAETIVPLITGTGWVAIRDVVLHPSGDYIVCDENADPRGLGGDTGALYRVNRDDLSVTVFGSGPGLVNPRRLTLSSTGRVLVADRGNTSSPVRVWRIDEVGGVPRLHWEPEDLGSVNAIFVLDVPTLTSSRFSVTDLNGSPVRPGDVVRYRFDVRNTGSFPANPVLVEIVGSPLGAVQPGSVVVDTGTATADDRAVNFAATVPPGGAASVTFDYTVATGLSEGTPIITEATLDAGNDLITSVLDVQRIPLELDPNDLVVLDRTAASGEVVSGSGTVFRWDADGDTLNPIASYLEFERLESIAIDPTDPEALYVCDSITDPDGLGTDTGAVFRIGTRDGRSIARYTGPELVAPMSVFFGPDGEPYVADLNADPLGIGIPSGAVFALDPITGDLTLAAASPSFRQPRHGTVLPDGTMLVVDRGADPYGLGDNVGTIFTVSPSGVVDVLATGGFLVDPVWAVRYPDGSYVVVDENSNPGETPGFTGALLRLNPTSGFLQVLAVSEAFSLPQMAKIGSQGEIYVVDRLADPNGAEPGRGAILRWHPSDGNVTVFAFTPRFRSPIGVEFVDSPTPVRAVDVAASIPRSGTVRLEWDVRADEAIARIDVYRASLPDAGAMPAPGDRLTGDGLSPTTRAYEDVGLPVDAEFRYWVGLTGVSGTSTLSGSIDVTVTVDAPRVFALRAARPNPFSSHTAFAFDVPQPGHRVAIRVYDIAGRRVRTLVDDDVVPGVHVVSWDGHDQRGARVAPGVYFYRMTSPGFVETRRAVVLR